MPLSFRRAVPGVGVTGSLTRDAASGACKPPELLDIEMEHVAGIGMFIATRWFNRLKVLKPRQADPFQHPADGGR